MCISKSNRNAITFQAEERGSSIGAVCSQFMFDHGIAYMVPDHYHKCPLSL